MILKYLAKHSFGKWLLGLAIAAIAAPAAQSQSITLVGSATNSCTYTSLLLRQDRSIEVQCDTGQSSGGSVAFASAKGSVLDNSGAATLTVSRSGNTGSATQATVAYACSATNGYSPTYLPGSSGALTFDGNESKTITVTPVTLPQGVGSIVACTLSSPTGATLGAQATFELTVTSPAVAGTISFAASSNSAQDNGALVDIVVTRSGNSTSPSTEAAVAYSCTANNGYVPSYSPSASGSLSFTGNQSKTIRVTTGPLPSGVTSAVVTCTLSSASGATLFSPTSFALTVTPAPAGSPGTVAFTTASNSTTDTGTPVTLTISRSGNTGTATQTQVSYSCSATQGYSPQYSPASIGQLSFSGNESKTITITPTTLPSGVTSAVVTCTLASASGGVTVGSPAAFQLTVNSGGSGGGCPTPPAGTQNYALSSTANRAPVVGLRNGAIAAVRFPSGGEGRAGGIHSITSPVVGEPGVFQFEALISECPGSFVRPAGNATGCGGFFRAGGSVVYNLINSADSCRLSPNRDYYLNLRWRSATGTDTCSSTTGCSAYVDFVYQ